MRRIPKLRKKKFCFQWGQWKESMFSTGARCHLRLLLRKHPDGFLFLLCDFLTGHSKLFHCSIFSSFIIPFHLPLWWERDRSGVSGSNLKWIDVLADLFTATSQDNIYCHYLCSTQRIQALKWHQDKTIIWRLLLQLVLHYYCLG